jgi:hypothetical protein
MANHVNYNPSELLVEELSEQYGITEAELASASVICSTCTCSGPSDEVATLSEAATPYKRVKLNSRIAETLCGGGWQPCSNPAALLGQHDRFV